MVTTAELILFIFVSTIGYSLSIFFIVRIFVIANSLRSPVPFVPSAREYVDSALKLLDIEEGENVADLGSGSGSFLIEAALKHPGANFTGIELNRGLVVWTRFMLWLRRIENVKVIHGDLLDQDLTDFDKVYLYMTTDFLVKLMPVLEDQLRDGALVVSLCFKFGPDFESRHNVEKFDVQNEKFKLYRWKKDELV